jgi:hypothetical protein
MYGEVMITDSETELYYIAKAMEAVTMGTPIAFTDRYSSTVCILLCVCGHDGMLVYIWC